MKATGILLLLLVWHSSFSQWTDNFDDGNFDIAPSWLGNTASFSVENGVLRLTAPAAAGSSFLALPSDVIDEAEWQFSCTFDFNPSSSNYAEIYLVADSTDLSKDINGYYLRLGSTSDDIALYRQSGGIKTMLIDGTDGRLGNSRNVFHVRITRNMGEFQLYSMLEGELDWHAEGAAVDNEIAASGYFGIKCTYTATRSDKFYFDNFSVAGLPYQDKDPPVIDTVYTISEHEFIVRFNEDIDELIIGTSQVEVSGANVIDGALVSGNQINVTSTTPLAVSNVLTISGISDLAGNAMVEQTLPFIHYSKQVLKYGDIVINELMIDPTPPEDLPEFEFIELINTTNRAIYMTGWSLSDKISVLSLPDYGLLPDEILLLSLKDAIAHFDVLKKLGFESWISLNNTSDSIALRNESNELIDLVPYTDSWYNDKDKMSGGWSLERIDPRHPCSGPFNWRAATDPKGGTPGTINSVYVPSTDTTAPTIQRASILNEDSILVVLDEPLRTANVVSALNDLAVITTTFWQDERNQILLNTAKLVPSTHYLLEFFNFEDCFGNVNPYDSVPILLPEVADVGDIIISEILFNPYENASDFIELYNRSPKYIELNRMKIANTGTPKEIAMNYLLEPNAFLVLTADTVSLGLEYPLANVDLSRTQELPQFNNDSGNAVLKNGDGTLIDSIHYEESWHFAYLTSFKGVSLERISPNLPGLTASNWVSGARTNNFATPGFANWLATEVVKGRLTISPQVIVPDANGRDDIALFTLDIGTADALVTITIYSLQGQPVRELTTNMLSNQFLQVTWDGTDQYGAIVPLGHYIAVARAVYDNGTATTYREKLVVGTGF